MHSWLYYLIVKNRRWIKTVAFFNFDHFVLVFAKVKVIQLCLVWSWPRVITHFISNRTCLRYHMAAADYGIVFCFCFPDLFLFYDWVFGRMVFLFWIRAVLRWPTVFKTLASCLKLVFAEPWRLLTVLWQLNWLLFERKLLNILSELSVNLLRLFQINYIRCIFLI